MHLLFRKAGRAIAINSVELPKGLSSKAVAARKAALVAAGTPPPFAEKLAIDAEQQQAWHDNPKLRTEGQARALTPAEQEAAAILEAQKLEPSAPSEKKLDEEPQNTVDQAGGQLPANVAGTPQDKGGTL